MANNGQSFQVYADKVTLIFVLIACFVFVTLGILGAIFAAERLSLVAGIIILLAITFFGVGFVYTFRVLVSHKPLLIINSEGVFDNASAFGVGLIRWEEIAKIFPYTLMNTPYLAIVPKDLRVILSRQGPSRRLVIRINQTFFKIPIFISGILLPISISNLLLQISKYKDICSSRKKVF
jgi:hypothetical protein